MTASTLQLLVLLTCALATCASAAGKPVVLQTKSFRWDIGADGPTTAFVDLKTGKDHCAKKKPFVLIKATGKEYPATSVKQAGDHLEVAFSGTDAVARLRVTEAKRFLTLAAESVQGKGVGELVFPDLQLKAADSRDRGFAACALALNLQTNVVSLPEATNRLTASAYAKFGFAGAKVAIIGCPANELRTAMQEAVSSSPELPHSPIGGPWALDSKAARESYLFNFNGITTTTAPDWIKLAKTLGFTQIDFHGGTSFRFGDCRPNPDIYPNGKADLKAAIDALHAAGIKAGLHTYAFFINKSCPYVTPIPSPGLAKDASFTLARGISATDDAVPVDESTASMSTITGFFVRNSVTVQIDDELITYSGVSKEPPFAFTGCQRGACGTTAAAHAKGAKVQHLKECFGLFVPDPDGPLFQEVAAKTAETFNDCGFDMIYLDALDGEDILGGGDNSWHYGSKFVFEIWKRVKRPALQEMSTFHHHLWFVRSRMGAWDHASRSYKTFIDIHAKANESNARMFLPGHLGWWALNPTASVDGERTFPDDIEYLCCKAIGADCGLAMMGVDPGTIQSSGALARLAAVLRAYEPLRRSGFFSNKARQRLKQPGQSFTLDTSDNKPYLKPVDYLARKVTGQSDGSAGWTVNNRYASQPLKLRIEVLWSAANYDSPDSKTLIDFSASPLLVSTSGPTAHASLVPSTEQVKTGNNSGLLTFSSARPPVKTARERFSPVEHGVRTGAGSFDWCSFTRKWPSELDLGNRKGIGAWVFGDGGGEVLNFQMRSPQHVSGGIADHYVPIDFTGWRYCELIEPEGERSEQYGWPYKGNVYAMYRELVNYNRVESFSVWLGGVKPGREAKIFISPIKALPVIENTLVDMKLTINGHPLKIPGDLKSGDYIEFTGLNGCTLYGANSEKKSDLQLSDTLPTLKPGPNAITLSCAGRPGLKSRLKVTISAEGPRFR